MGKQNNTPALKLNLADVLMIPTVVSRATGEGGVGSGWTNPEQAPVARYKLGGSDICNSLVAGSLHWYPFGDASLPMREDGVSENGQSCAGIQQE